MTTSESMTTQLQRFGDQIPFIRDRRFTAFLPREKREGGKFIKDEWDTLAALIECFEERIELMIVRGDGEDFIRVVVYDGSMKKHLIPVPRAVVDRLLHLRFVEVTSRSSNGHIEQTELEPTESGMRALVAHIRSLQRRNKTP